VIREVIKSYSNFFILLSGVDNGISNNVRFIQYLEYSFLCRPEVLKCETKFEVILKN
jgi:hypothetical protein